MSVVQQVARLRLVRLETVRPALNMAQHLRDDVLEIATTEDEDSPSYLGGRPPDSPLYSPICSFDNDDTIHFKIEHAARAVRLHMAHWNALFPELQWRSRGPWAVRVLRDLGLLCHIVPFVKQITNLDGKVWVHRMWYDEKRDVVRVCGEHEEPRLVVYTDPRLPGR